MLSRRFRTAASPATSVVLLVTKSAEGVGPTPTRSKLAVASWVVLWPETTTPARTDEPMVIVAVPTFVQCWPSGDVYPLNVLPCRTTRTHAGFGAVPPEVVDVLPPVD